MSTKYKDLSGALGKQLNNVSGSLDIVWENTEYDPTIGRPFLRTWLLPNQTINSSLGLKGFSEYNGIFQIDCMYPIGSGWGSARTNVDTICSSFKRGTIVTYNKVEVRIWGSSPEPALIDGDWYRLPISVYYSSWATV
jgi:hypothetical protein